LIFLKPAELEEVSEFDANDISHTEESIEYKAGVTSEVFFIELAISLGKPYIFYYIDTEFIEKSN